MLDLVWGNGSPPTKCKWWSLLYPQISADRICSFGDRAIFTFWHFGLKLPIRANFYGVLGAYVPPYDVIYRCNPQKALPCAETRRLSHKTWKIGPTVRPGLGAGSRKKGQDRTGQSKEVTKALYFTYLGRSPTEPIFTKICTVVAVRDVITCANFWSEIFRGYDFTGGRISRFPIDSFMGLTTVQRYCAACDGLRPT